MHEKLKEFRLGILGWPLKTTLSPAIFNLFFSRSGVIGKYSPVRLRPQNFSKTFMNNCKFDGLNVTSPHKQKAFILSDIKTENAKAAMASNLLKKSGEKWISYNTDIPAFRKTLRKHFESACVFGSGGAASAVLLALGQLKTKKIYCISSKGILPPNFRTLKKKYPHSKFYFIKQKTNAPPASIYVNARVPMASFPEFPPQAANSLFYDLNYSGENEFLAKAHKLKAQVKTGEEMLFYQAIYSFRIMTGIKIKENDAREIVREILCLNI